MSLLCYRRHRFPAEIIQHAIWLYLRFTMSYRDVEELLAERGLDISYENGAALGAEIRSRDRATAASASPSAERPMAFAQLAHLPGAHEAQHVADEVPQRALQSPAAAHQRPLRPLLDRFRAVSGRGAGVQGACCVSPSAAEVGVLSHRPYCLPSAGHRCRSVRFWL